MSSKLNGITKQIENALSKSRGLSDEDFIQLLHNIEVLKMHIIQLRRKFKNIELYETENLNFHQFLNTQKNDNFRYSKSLV